MKSLRAAFPVVIAIAATWYITAGTAAQSSIPNGVFIRDGNGELWLVLDGKKVAIPVWIAPFEDVRAIPKSDKWAVANEAGAIVAGDPPSWLSGDGLAARYGPISPLESRTIVREAMGQEALGTFLGQSLKATVTEMSILDSLPEAPGSHERFSQRFARGKFVVVAVKLENVGKRAVCCVPEYTLKDSRGRQFTGATETSDEEVKQAMSTVYLMSPYRGDLQPSMPVSHLLVYDVPADAGGFVLSSDR